LTAFQKYATISNMLFHIIDKKQECPSVYADKAIIKHPEYNKYSKTWSYSPVLKDYDIEYASLYIKNNNIDQCCPDSIKEEWEQVKKKHHAFYNSFREAKVKHYDYCFYDLVPESFSMKYFDLRTQITEHVLSNYEKPDNYEFLLELSKLISDIESNKLRIDLSQLSDQLHQYKTRRFKAKVKCLRPFIEYNIFGTITGRLTTKRDSFPILTMDKNYRKIVKPKNDWFIELDFNAAELRCLLALNEEEQPNNDIHEWHGQILNKLSDHVFDRDEIKRKIFGWLYGPPNASLGIPQIEKYYDKKKALNKYWDGTQIKNPFGRVVQADEFHALNAIIQSTTSDVFLRRAIAVNKILRNRKSFTMGLIHDSMVIDFSRDDKEILPELMDVFGNTDMGKFKVNASLGTNFGNMKRFK